MSEFHTKQDLVLKYHILQNYCIYNGNTCRIVKLWEFYRSHPSAGNKQVFTSCPFLPCACVHVLLPELHIRNAIGFSRSVDDATADQWVLIILIWSSCSGICAHDLWHTFCCVLSFFLYFLLFYVVIFFCFFIFSVFTFLLAIPCYC